ncbi:sensor domain-containing protein [Nitrosomonas supralitoralis]|nr:EAL domain-containing protein [Nitrosomonas supralitoralis]
MVELKTLTNQVVSYTYMKDRMGRYTYVNESAQDLFGIPPEHIIGQSDHHFFDLKTSDQLKHNDNLVLEFGETVKQEERVIIKSTGAMRIYQSIKKPIRDDQGQITGLYGISTDITQFRQTEDTLNQIIKHLSLARHASGVGIWIWDIVQDKLVWDDQMFVLYGISKDNFRGVYKDWSSAVYTDDLQRAEKEIQMALCGEKKLDTVFRVCWPDGTIHNIHVIATVIPDASGKPLHMVGTNSDITSHMQSDDFMSLTSAIYQSSGEAIMVTDENNIIRHVNPAFTHMTGYELSDVMGKSPRILNSGRHDKNFYQEMWQTIMRTDHWQGEIWERHKDDIIYARWLSISVIRHPNGDIYCYVAQFSDITEKKQYDELILTQANYDQLTGLPNRNLFKDRLAQEIKKSHRNKLPLALCLLDLDHFKEINDTLGHAAGDELLKKAANRIKSCMREIDTVARLGGDEFIVILPEINNKLCIEIVAQHIIQELGKPFQFNQNETLYHISTSIGIVVFPEDGADMESLMKHADQAMYVAKQQGRGRYCYFTAAMQQKVNEKMTLMRDLREALTRNELHVYYQPILKLTDHRIVKAEALLRWKHPQRGMINPASFIPLAEESGLIHEIGDWVFDQVIVHIQKWHEQFGHIIQVSVNKSPAQFKHANKQLWSEKLTRLKLPGNCINVEITEGLLLKDTAEIKDCLLEFHNNGIDVSIDDFGTGFSSLSYLKAFDIDYLKIDRSFISNLTKNTTDPALVEAIILMAQKLNIKTIAEGVETREQQDLLIELGCDYAQGHFYSLPLPENEFEKLINCIPSMKVG